MKKFLSVISLVCAIIFCVSPISAFASSNAVNDDVFSVGTFDAEEYSYAVYPQSRATGLINDYQVGISKYTTMLKIEGYTDCISSVTKCGFSEIIVERRATGTTDWSVYRTYTDIYEEDSSYTLEKYVSVYTGYQYRVIATHYARQNIFLSEEITGTTGYLQF